MPDHINQLRAEFRQELSVVTTEAEVTILRDSWVGRKSGRLTAEMKTLGKLSPEERRETGQRLNVLKEELEAAITSLEQDFALRRETAQLAEERIDVTLPGALHGGGASPSDHAVAAADRGHLRLDGVSHRGWSGDRDQFLQF
jgi:phenylalanyl-tRNA synthetase alpha chain